MSSFPPRPASRPNQRHRLKSVNERSRAKELNTVIESWVDLTADVNAINRGEAQRRGDIYMVNGRRYRLEEHGTLAPLDGIGMHVLSREAYRALGVYNKFGLTDKAEQYLDRRNSPQADRDAARRAWLAENQRDEQ